MTNAEARFNKIHIRKVYACLAVTCHLHFWQNGRDFLRATAVTRGWNGYRNKSQHRKLTLDKTILPPLQQGFEPTTFWSQVRRSNHWAIRNHHFVVVYTQKLDLVHCQQRWSLLSFVLGRLNQHIMLTLVRECRFIKMIYYHYWVGCGKHGCYQLLCSAVYGYRKKKKTY